jgi:hypothetical protein
MKITPAIILTVFCAFTANAQPAPDMSSQENYFYASDGYAVRQYTLTAGSVNDAGTCTGSYTDNIYSVAYGNDIIHGSTNRTIYASSFSGAEGKIIQWNGTAWDVLHSDSMYYLNGGAYGCYIYYIQYNFSVTPNTQAIVRLQSDGSIDKIFEDNSLIFTVADLAVDSLGNIYCFRGAALGNTSELTVINPAGAIVASYATTLNYAMGFYGSMFMNGTLYVGQDLGTPALYPINYSGTTATMGLPVFNYYTMTDLGNSHHVVNNTTFVAEAAPQENISATMHGNYLVVNNASGHLVTATVFDASGKLLISQKVEDATTEVDMQQFRNGVYFVQIDNGQKRLLAKRVMKAG